MKVLNEQGYLVDYNKLEWGELYANRNDPHTLRKHFPLHAGQQAIMNSTARFRLALGGKNSGKSVIGGCFLLEQLQKNPQGIFLVVAPTFQIVTSSTMEVWKKTVRGTEFEGTPHFGNQPWYDCATGAKIYFKSAVDPDSMEGLKPVAAWLDECGAISLQSWRAVKGRLVGTAGPAMLTTTPYPKHDWLIKEFIAKCEAGHKDYFYCTFPSTLNPCQDLDALAEEKETLSEWEYQVRYEGKFTKHKGLVYGDVDKCYRTKNDCIHFDESKHVLAAIDWGGGQDPTVILMGMLDSQNNLWVWMEKYVKGDTEDIIQTIHNLKKWHKSFAEVSGKTVSRFWCDHNPSVIRALRRLGLRAKPALKGRNTIALGISLVTSRINRTIKGKPGGLYIVREKCPHLAREASLYRYPSEDDGECYGEVPIDKHNHVMDALRYMVLGLDKKQRA